ncbi:MAG: glycosyltransferase family 4 protein [Deltaproteobacteria bacterium]|nr:glycosyltransferase family 4 protein [Deltaproteobacteria bacterium]
MTCAVRILFVTQVQLDEPSGRAHHVCALARALAQLDHDVTLLAPGFENPIPGVHRIRPPGGLPPGLGLEAVLALRAAFAARRADAGYVRLSSSSSIVSVALAGLRLPLVLELNGPVVDEQRRRGGRVAAAVVRQSLRRVIALAAHVVAVDSVTARHAQSVLGAQRVSVVDNGADLETAIPGSRAEARDRLGLRRAGHVVTLTGTLAPEQRLDLLLQAHQQLDGVTLVVAGGGPGQALLDAARSGRTGSSLVALGTVAHEQAVLAVQAADVCVDLREDRLGLKCLEYAAVGRRLVTCRVEGVDRLHGLYPGLEALHVIDAPTVSAVRLGLEAALEAEARRGPLPLEAVNRARATLGWEHSARHIASLIAQCV